MLLFLHCGIKPILGWVSLNLGRLLLLIHFFQSSSKQFYKLTVPDYIQSVLLARRPFINSWLLMKGLEYLFINNRLTGWGLTPPFDSYSIVKLCPLGKKIRYVSEIKGRCQPSTCQPFNYYNNILYYLLFLFLIVHGSYTWYIL